MCGESTVSFLDAQIGPVPLKLVLAVAAIGIVGLLYLASARSKPNSN
jgi:hypothetical protein